MRVGRRHCVVSMTALKSIPRRAGTRTDRLAAIPLARWRNRSAPKGRKRITLRTMSFFSASPPLANGRRVAESSLAGTDPRSNRKLYGHIVACRMTAPQRISSPRVCFRESWITGGSYQTGRSDPNPGTGTFTELPQNRDSHRNRRRGTFLRTTALERGTFSRGGIPTTLRSVGLSTKVSLLCRYLSRRIGSGSVR